MQVSNKILEKIQKCLNLSKSSNPGEAANALRMAKAMMKKYGVSVAQVGLSEVKESRLKYHKNHVNRAWESAVIDLIEKVFAVRIIIGTYDNYYPAELSFYGINSQAEVAAYIYEIVMRQLMRDRREFVKTLPRRMTRTHKIEQADIYCEAWVSAVAGQVKDLYQAKDPRIDEFVQPEKMKEIEIKPRVSSSRLFRDIASMQAGLEDGAEAQVFLGVNDAPKASQISGYSATNLLR